MAQKLTVSIIIPNYNGKKLLEKNLPRVIEACRDQKAVIEIIIVDDGSTDKSKEVVKKVSRKFAKNSRYSRKIKLLTNPKNLGFSSTVNKGTKEATGDIIILLNTDVYPEKGFLEAVLPHFQDKKVFAVGMMDKSNEKGKEILRGRGIGWWQKGFYIHKRGEVDKSDTDWASGGSSAFRRTIFLKLGGFAPIYNPFYWEDIDLSYQALKKGYKILFEPKAICFHKHEEGTIKQTYSKKEIEAIAYRNQFIFVWRNANIFQLSSHLFWLPYHLVFTNIKSRFLLGRGFLKALLKLPYLLKTSLFLK